MTDSTASHHAADCFCVPVAGSRHCDPSHGGLPAGDCSWQDTSVLHTHLGPQAYTVTPPGPHATMRHTSTACAGSPQGHRCHHLTTAAQLSRTGRPRHRVMLHRELDRFPRWPGSDHHWRCHTIEPPPPPVLCLPTPMLAPPTQNNLSLAHLSKADLEIHTIISTVSPPTRQLASAACTVALP